MIKFILFSFFLLPLEIKAVAVNDNIKKVSVEFEWELIPGAKRYQVQILDKEKNIVTSLVSNSVEFSTQLEPNIYFVKGRAQDQRGAYSEWSTLSEFTVPPKKVEIKDEPAKALQLDPKTFKSTVNFEWSPSPGAQTYKLELLEKTTNKTYTFTTKDTRFSTALVSGEYTYKITAISSQGIESESLSNETPFFIHKIAMKAPEQLTNENNTLSWKNSLPLPVTIDIGYRRFGGKWTSRNSVDLTGETFDINSISPLPPGEYSFKLYYKNALGEISPSADYLHIQKPKESELK